MEIGSEPTFELYLDHISDVFKAVHRVLRKDGTCWINVGDSYASNWPCQRRNVIGTGSLEDGTRPNRPSRLPFETKDKDLLMMPARLAMRLQADGYFLRSMIPWIKRNPCPESVTDRPSTACEYVFLLSKSQSYYYDRFAVRMGCSENTHQRAAAGYKHAFASQFRGSPTDKRHVNGKVIPPMGVNPKADDSADGSKQNASFAEACSGPVSARNRRNSDWFMESFQGLLTDDCGDPLALIVNPKGTSIKHFASYPKKLVEPMIKASTSERGCCPKCGAPWERITERVDQGFDGSRYGERAVAASGGAISGGTAHSTLGSPNGKLVGQTATTGWRPTCDCKARAEKHCLEVAHTVRQMECPDYAPVPCTVIDPFGGTGTTGEVAIELGRKAIIVELNPDYAQFVAQRCDVTPGLPLA